MLMIGSTMSLPESSSGLNAFDRRIAASIESYSPPCKPEVTHRVGPLLFPLIIERGIFRGKPSYLSHCVIEMRGLIGSNADGTDL